MNKKTVYCLFFCLTILGCSGALFALSIKNIAAYPVPFNPKKGATLLTIDEPGNSPIGNFNIKISIFDINGDEVLTNTASSFPIKWNARNEKGLLVKPGLYIIKLQIEDKDTGTFQKKMLRILVRY